MTLPTVKTFLCKIPLLVGVYFIGVFFTVVYAGGTVVFTILAVTNRNHKAFLTRFSFLSSIAFIFLFLSVLLLVGTKRKKITLVKQWLIIHSVVFFTIVLMFIIYIIYYFVKMEITAGIWVVVACGVVLGVLPYSLIVMYSFYLVWAAEEEKKKQMEFRKSSLLSEELELADEQEAASIIRVTLPD